MILFIYGPDTFRSRQYLKQSVGQFKKQRDPQGYNIVFLDGKNEEPGKILTEIFSAPFLSAKRMIVIENILSIADKELLEELKEKVKEKKFPESNIVIFWQGETLSKVKEAKELETLLKKEKYAQEFEPLKGAKLANWAKKELEARAAAAAPEALAYLCEHVPDMWRLNSLIDQLAAYAGSQIAVSDVRLFLEEKIDDSIFNMVDAIAAGNGKLAYKLLNYQRRSGEEEGKIFGLIVWQMRILLEMADALERDAGLTSETLAKQLGIHPFVAKKNLALVRRTPISKLQNLYRRLLAIDIKTKTGAAPQDVSVDLFVASV